MLLRRITLPLTAISGLVLLWSALVAGFNIPAYLVPEPWLVFEALFNALQSRDIYIHIGSTVFNVLAGYGIGSATALLLAFVMAESRTAERFLLPVVTALQSIPKIALAPLIFIWVGFGQPAIITLSALASYFPILISAVVGLRAADPDLLDMYRTFGASRSRMLTDIKIPAALSQIFAGLEIGLVFALIGTVVMEFLVGTGGLGFVIQNSANTVDLPLNFAGIVLLGAVGMFLSFVLRSIRRRMVFWETSFEIREHESR